MSDKDKIEMFNGALIQHGTLSDRIYLMKIKDAEPVELVHEMRKLAEKKHYSKIFVKVPARRAETFYNVGYEKEAHIPGFYNGDEDAVFLALYFSRLRKIEPEKKTLDGNLKIARQKAADNKKVSLPEGAIIRECTPGDAERMAVVYKEVFPSYPFPIDDPVYLVKTMAENIVYFGVEFGGELISLASSEMDVESSNVEFTDFATLPAHRGSGLALNLLETMEEAMKARGIKTGYTIARSMSTGMNVTFARAGYLYTGRLINNTNISGQIESMNIWYKPLG